MDVLKFLDDELCDAMWANDPQQSQIDGFNAAIAEITRLRAALAIFSDDISWRQNGVCDPNSGSFRGQTIAQQALSGGNNQAKTV
jgi:hypothetical protein